MSDRFMDGRTDWHNWMRDTMHIDPSDTKSIELVWAVIARCEMDNKPAPKPETDGDAHAKCVAFVRSLPFVRLQNAQIYSEWVEETANLVEHFAALLASHGQGERALREALSGIGEIVQHATETMDHKAICEALGRIKYLVGHALEDHHADR